MRNRLNNLGGARPQAHPHANRHPDQTGQRDQYRHAQQSDQREDAHLAGLAKGGVRHKHPREVPSGHRHNHNDERIPVLVEPVRCHLAGQIGQRLWRPGTAGPAHRGVEGCTQGRDYPGALHHLQRPGFWCIRIRLLLDLKTIDPRYERAKQQLVVDQNDNRHRQDCPPNRMEVALFDGQRHIGAHSRQGDGLGTDGKGLGQHDKEPAA